MPHQCIECGRRFPDGSKEMLSGCPDCGGNKFQFKPSGRSDGHSTDSTETDTESATPANSTEPDARSTEPGPTGPPTTDSPEEPESDRTSPVEDDSETAAADRSPGENPHESSDWGSGSEDPGPNAPTSDPDTPRSDSHEDSAQASARSDVVSPDELDRASHEVEATATDPDDASGPRPDVDELRNELNEQFESIRIVNPGEYELNLMELYDRQEYIISLQEDGRYVIEMPDAWDIGTE